MPQPIIVAITAIIAIAKFSSISEKTRSLCRVFLFGAESLSGVQRCEGVNADRIY
jgi:hypothetical protein